MGPDLLDGDVELTEFTEIGVDAVKGVKRGANGAPHLIIKSLAEPVVKADASDSSDADDCPTCNGDGKIKGNSTTCPDCDGTGKVKAAKSLPEWHPVAKQAVTVLVKDGRTGTEADVAWNFIKAIDQAGNVDEQPDIDGGKQAIALLAKLIGYEAQELEAGCMGEVWDIQLLCDAVSAVKCWLSGEVAGQMADAADDSGVVMASEAAKAKMSTASQNDLPDSAFAYIEPGGEKDSDGKTTPRSKRHFPVHDKAHADNAAARIAQGAEFGDKAKAKVAAAQKKFGETGTSKSDTVAESDGSMQTDQELDARIAKAVEGAVAKATGDSEGRIKAAEDRAAKAEAAVEKFAAMPRAGGPVMSITKPAGTAGSAKAELIAKADEADRLADQVSDPNEAASFRQLAAQKRTEADKLP